MKSTFFNFRPHLDGGEVHGVFDDVVVVMQSQSLYIHRLVERPRVRGVLLGEHLLHDAGAVAQLLLQLGAVGAGGRAIGEMVLGIRRFFLGLFGRPSALSPREGLP